MDNKLIQYQYLLLFREVKQIVEEELSVLSLVDKENEQYRRLLYIIIDDYFKNVDSNDPHNYKQIYFSIYKYFEPRLNEVNKFILDKRFSVIDEKLVK